MGEKLFQSAGAMKESPRPPNPSLGNPKEQRYRWDFPREDGRRSAFVIAVIGAAYAAAAVNDFLVLQGTLLGLSLAFRGLLLVVTVGVLLMLRRANARRQQDKALHVSLRAAAIFASRVHLSKAPSSQIQGALIASGPIVPGAAFGRVIAAASVALVTLGDPQADMEGPARLTGVLGLVSIHVVGNLAAHSFEGPRRTRFEAVLRERQLERRWA